MTISRPARWLGIRIALNVVLLAGILFLVVLSLFYIGLTAQLGGITIGVIVALAAYRAGLWPAVTASGLFVFGYLLPTTPECADDPGCDGGISDAWPEQAVWVVTYIALLLAGVVAGFRRDLWAWRALRRDDNAGEPPPG